MAESYKVRIRVKSRKGICADGHEVGDQWITEGKTPEGTCLSAFSAMLPSLNVLMYGGSLYWEDDPDIATIACPDADNCVVFELRRLRE